MDRQDFFDTITRARNISRRILFRLNRNDWEGFENLKTLNPKHFHLVNFSSWESLKKRLVENWAKELQVSIVLELLGAHPDTELAYLTFLTHLLARHVQYVEIDAVSVNVYLEQLRALQRTRTAVATSLKLRILQPLWNLLGGINYEYLLEKGETYSFPIDQECLRLNHFSTFEELQAALQEMEEAWENKIEVNLKIDQEHNRASIHLKLKNF
ncbi:MAG: hypothetical protein NTU97_00750 [Candidatus Magasanikbacteria bacterium]|nr:hypothetical protein [Candidatus Magasanikbacteria bacterium]